MRIYFCFGNFAKLSFFQSSGNSSVTALISGQLLCTVTSLCITKSVIAGVIVISETLLEKTFENVVKVTKVEGVVLDAKKVVIASKVIVNAVTNFLKTRLIYSC